MGSLDHDDRMVFSGNLECFRWIVMKRTTDGRLELATHVPGVVLALCSWRTTASKWEFALKRSRGRGVAKSSFCLAQNMVLAGRKGQWKREGIG